jgi:hypothetical protein
MRGLFVRSILGALAAVSVVACDGGDPADPGDGGMVVRQDSGGNTGGQCGRAGRDGITDCFPADCNPGQYCDEGNDRCVVGCTSDANCGPTEYCDRPAGSAIGVCAGCTPVSVPSDPRIDACIEAVDRALECGAIIAPEAVAGRMACQNEPAAVTQPLVDCVETAGADCAAVATCFDGGNGPEVEACEQECRDMGAHCAEEIAFGAIETAECVDSCGFSADPENITECLVAAQGRADRFFGCSEATGCFF